MSPSLGALPIDLPRLLETRMLVQCQSGNGKSWALRRVLEQTAPRVQQIVIDTEGEFASLRERFDYIIAAPRDGDAVATPATATALARALWGAGVSAVVDIYDLKPHERTVFVRRFLESLISAPKSMWHNTLIVIDEVHTYAPQVGSAESLGAVADLASRGRKRGLALIGATQRLAKLSKDVAAELQNKMVGGTSLDVDVARAGEELGMSKADARSVLRVLNPGQFYVYGPALSRAVVHTKIGPVVTTHPEIGKRLLTAPPPASAALRAKLAALEGIQREAEAEAQTVDELRGELAKVRRSLTLAEKAAAGAGVPEAEVQRRIDAAVRAAKAATPPAGLSAQQLKAVAGAIAALQAVEAGSGTVTTTTWPRAQPANRQAAAQATPVPAAASVDGLRSGAVRILQELAARAPAGYSRPQVGALTQFSHRGGTFGTYFSDLRRAGLLEERGGLVFATDAGITALGASVPATPKTHDEMMALWRRALRSGAFAMLEAIVRAGADGTSRAAVAAEVGMVPTGGTFGTYLSDLRRNGLITDTGGRCVANDILFPKSK